VLLVGAGIFAIFFFLTLWMQILNGWSPIKTGVAFLPFPVSSAPAPPSRPTCSAGSGRARCCSSGRSSPRRAAAPGAAPRARTRATLGVIIPSFVLVRLRHGLSFVAVTSAAVAGVPQQRRRRLRSCSTPGSRSASRSALALLTAVSTARTDSLLHDGRRRPEGARASAAGRRPTCACAVRRAQRRLEPRFAERRLLVDGRPSCMSLVR
jgi:hypothetical protein